LATRLADGSIQLNDGRQVFANTLIQADVLIEILPLLTPPPVWPFISGGGGGGAGTPGARGADGEAGAQGPQGPGIGNPGPQGNQGNQGVAGTAGTNGAQGNQGNQGNAGTAGTNGAQGNQGNQGIAGTAGTNGAQGNQGNQGIAGTAGTNGAQGNQGFQGFGFQGAQGPSGGGGNDIFAATRVVSLIAGEGTDLTIAAAIANLPAEGGYIYIKQGTYPIAATLTLPDKPVVIKGSGDGTIISLGANVIAAFTIPDGLADRREYVFEDFLVTGTSVAGQIFVSIQESNAFATTHIVRVNTSGIQIPIDITDGVAAEPVTVTVDDSHFIPLADGSSILVNTPINTGITVNAWMQRVRYYDEYTDTIVGALTSGNVFTTGVNFMGEDCVFSLGTSSIVGAWDFTDSHFINFGPGANPVITIFGDSFGVIQSAMLGCTGQFVNFTIFSNGMRCFGCAFRASSFTDGSISTFTDCYFFTDLTADGWVIFGTGNTTVVGCFFDNQGLNFVLDGNFEAVIGNRFQSAGAGGLTAIIRTTTGSARISDNRFITTGAPPILEAGLTSTNRIDNNTFSTSLPSLLAASDAVVNGFKRKNITGQATVNALTSVFTHQNDKGLAGSGSIKNTGANSLTVRRNVTDGYGVTATQDDVVLSGAVLTWPMDTAIGTALPAYVSFEILVQSTTPGSPTTFDLRHSSTGAY